MLHFRSSDACVDASAKNRRTDFSIYEGRANFRQWDKIGKNVLLLCPTKLPKHVRCTLLSLQLATTKCKRGSWPVFSLSTPWRHIREIEEGLQWRDVGTFTPRPLYLWERNPVPFEQEAGGGGGSSTAGVDVSERWSTSCPYRYSKPG